MKPIDVERAEEAIAQETYHQHLAVDAQERGLLQRLVEERDPRELLDQDVVFYTGLGLIVEANVRGLVREWQARA